MGGLGTGIQVQGSGLKDAVLGRWGCKDPGDRPPQDWGTGLWELEARKEPLGQALGGETGGIRATGVQ